MRYRGDVTDELGGGIRSRHAGIFQEMDWGDSHMESDRHILLVMKEFSKARLKIVIEFEVPSVTVLSSLQVRILGMKRPRRLIIGTQ